MPKKVDLIGKRFTRFYVLEDSGDRTSRGSVIWRCICDCGTVKKVDSGSLIHRRTFSCGCLNIELLEKRGTHLHNTRKRGKTPEYLTWDGMKQRCTNANAHGYKNYGGRGIHICRRWRCSFENFLKDMGERPPNRTIDRIDNNGPYGPWNCRWATPKQQANNKRRL